MCTLRLSFSTLFAFLISCVLSFPTWGLAQGSVQGAWKVVEVSFTSTDTSWTNKSPQPGIFIFTEKHYNDMYVRGNEPRKVADPSNRTDDETVAAYNSFHANSGTYEVLSSSKLTTRTMVAKSPTRMADAYINEYVYEIDGNTLWLTDTTSSGGKYVRKYTRLE